MRFNKFLVEIDKRRLEGKSSVKKEHSAVAMFAKSKSKTKKGKKQLESSPISNFEKGASTGSISASTKCMPSSAIGVKSNFPKKGRKAFVCPEKKVEEVN